MKGWAAILTSLGVTLALYLQAKGVAPAANWSQVIVQLSGLLGIMLLAWGFILAIRHPLLEKLFGGLDWTYKAHHIVGGLSLVLLLQHPLFLIIGDLPKNALGLYLLPFGNLDYLLGQVALYFMLFLLILTFYVPLPYRYWKWSHEWMGIVVIMGGLHSLLVFSDVSTFPPLTLWIMGWSLLATVAYLYKRFYYYKHETARYSVRTIGRSKELLLISLVAKDTVIKFGPGQYGFFALPDKLRDDHAFSVLKQQGKTVIIGCKVLGNFTKTLTTLGAGDELVIKGPYGTFGEKMESVNHAVWIAGGIGITPFLSMAGHIKSKQKVEMFFCAKVKPHPVITDPFVRLSERNDNFVWSACESSKTGRLKIKDVLDSTGHDLNATYMLCGPNEMMEGLATDLALFGIKRSHIIYEDFGFK